MNDTEYISCADTAKLVRASLKQAFPGVKFSVRSSVYSGGASITVRWVDGPVSKDVEAVAQKYAGGGFDGSIDLAYNVDHYLLPDGKTVVAHSPGTVGSMGNYPAINGPGAEFAEITGARRVSFLADYVFCERELSEKVKGILSRVLADSGTNPDHDPYWEQTQTWQMSQEVAFA